MKTVSRTPSFLEVVIQNLHCQVYERMTAVDFASLKKKIAGNYDWSVENNFCAKMAKRI